MSNQWLDELIGDDPKTHSVRVQRDGDDVVLRHRWGSSSASYAIAGFMFLWTVGCVFFVRSVIDQPSLVPILFGIPLLEGWLLVFCVLCATFFGRTDLRLGLHALEFTQTVLLYRRYRHVPLVEIEEFTEYSREVQHGESGTRTETGLMVVTLGKPLRFAQDVNQGELSHLIELLNGHLQELRRSKPGEGSIGTILGRRDEPFLKGAVLGPPSDSEVELFKDWNHTVFMRRFPFDLANLGMMTFLNFLWNGSVSAFVYMAIHESHWVLSLFLIPFELLGALLFLSWMAVLTSPWWRLEWALGADEITTRFSIFGLGRTRAYDLQSLNTIEVRKTINPKTKHFLPRFNGEENDRPYAVGLVDRDACDLLVIDDLTEGEARWIECEFRVLLKNVLSKPASDNAPAPPPQSLWDRELHGEF